MTDKAAYREKAGETPGAWAEVGKTAQTTAEAFDKLAAHLAKMQAAFADLGKKTEDAGDKQSAAGDGWTHMASCAKVFGSNFAGASLSLAKWTGLTSLFAGILSAGGLYGISRMATGVGGRRTAAMSYGMSYGEIQSYRTNFERLGNSGGLLAGFNNAMTSAEARGPLYSLLGAHADERLAGKSAAGALAEALPDIKRYVDSLDPNTMGAVLHARGLDRAGLDLQTAQTMRRMSPKEVDEVAAGFRADVNPMDLPPELAKDWQDFSTAVSEAGAEIENHFVTNLVNLEPGLAALATSTADLVDHMLKDGGPVEAGLKSVGRGLEGFADTVGSKDFIGAINLFVDRVEIINRIALPRFIDFGLDVLEAGADLANSAVGLPRQYDDTPAHYIPQPRVPSVRGLDGKTPRDPAQRKANRWLNWLSGQDRAEPWHPDKPPPASPAPAGRPSPADQSTWTPNTGNFGPSLPAPPRWTFPADQSTSRDDRRMSRMADLDADPDRRNFGPWTFPTDGGAVGSWAQVGWTEKPFRDEAAAIWGSSHGALEGGNTAQRVDSWRSFGAKGGRQVDGVNVVQLEGGGADVRVDSRAVGPMVPFAY